MYDIKCCYTYIQYITLVTKCNKNLHFYQFTLQYYTISSRKLQNTTLLSYFTNTYLHTITGCYNTCNLNYITCKLYYLLQYNVFAYSKKLWILLGYAGEKDIESLSENLNLSKKFSIWRKSWRKIFPIESLSENSKHSYISRRLYDYRWKWLNYFFAA